MISARGKVFRDPIHGLIRIEPEDAFVLDLINLPEFQRLRRVRQLGVSSYTYPGAEHTRFAHSLGVFNFAQRILQNLRRRYASEKNLVALIDENRQTVLAAALLHDIGHGPFSHMIERSFESFEDHETKTVAMVQGGGNVTNCLTKHGVDPKAVSNLILKTSEYRFLVDIITSQLDADRMDYILRDAINTGVKYGVFDSEWVLNSLCLGGEPNQPPPKDLRGLRLCLEDRRGLYSAEQIVVARMHMSYQVYYHQATRGWEAHLLCLLKLAAEELGGGNLVAGTPPTVVKFLKGENITGDAWLWFDESAVQSALHIWAAQGDLADLAELSRGFLLRQKAFLCRELSDLTIEKTLRLSIGLNNAGRDGIDWILDDPKFTSYKDFDSGFRSVTQKLDKGAVSTSAILVSDGNLDSVAKPAETVSVVLGALGDNPEGKNKSLTRIYYRRIISEKIEKVLVSLGLK